MSTEDPFKDSNEKEKAESTLAVLNLDELLTYENPNAEEYKKLIDEASAEAELAVSNPGRAKTLSRSAGGAAYFTNFSMHWWSVCTQNLKTNDLLKSKFNGGTLVNLGAGTPSPFLEILDNGTIINVDKYAFGHSGIKKSIELVKMYTEKEGGVDSFCVSADMLDFISRLPSNSVNIEVDGVDYDIIHNPEYHKALAREILRVTKKGGLVIGTQSNPLYFAKELPRVKMINGEILEKE
ncbi:MAG: hypothetical protein WC385_02430 [Candidatus Paceibacterota bacterium]|jgi:hypothetical protein